MSWQKLLRPAFGALKAYEPEPQEGDALLDANESPYAAPPAFLQGLDAWAAAVALNRYPDPSCKELLQAASAYYRVPESCLLPGNGSDELIALLLGAFGGVDRRCLVACPTFSMYALCAKTAGWEVLEEPLGSAFELTPAFVERARREKPALIFLASPNNPTGNAMDAGLVDALLQLDSLLVLDEAYAEFSAHPSRISQAPDKGNLVVLRTLSKAFGLAALRVGFLAGQASLVSELNKARLPYNIDALAQSLAARALRMPGDFARARERVMADKPRLLQGLREIPGVEVFASDANFFLFRHPRSAALHRHLLDRGLRLRRFSGGRLDNCMRITVGSSAEVERCLAAFKEWKP